jgi:hypothetical protein
MNGFMVTPKEVHAAAQTILRAATENPGPAISERDLLRLAIDFLNEGRLSGPLLFAPGVRVIKPLGAGADWIPTPADVTPSKWLEGIQQQLRHDFSAMAMGTIKRDAIVRLMKDASQMVATPTFTVERRQSRSLRVNWHYIPTSLEAVLSYAALLLRDDARGFGNDLKRCSLEACGIFFFSSDQSKETGKPRERFCKKEHMDQKHRSTSAARTRKWRERKAEKAAKAAGGVDR